MKFTSLAIAFAVIGTEAVKIEVGPAERVMTAACHGAMRICEENGAFKEGSIFKEDSISRARRKQREIDERAREAEAKYHKVRDKRKAAEEAERAQREGYHGHTDHAGYDWKTGHDVTRHGDHDHH